MDRPQSVVPCWGLQFGDTDGSVTVEEEYAPWNPSFAVAYNNGPKGSVKLLEKGILEMMYTRGDKPEKYGRCGSEWYRFVNGAQTDAQDEELRNTLLELLDAFPTYQLGTQRGLGEATDAFNAALRAVTKGLASKDGMPTRYDQILLVRLLTDSRYWKDHNSIDWIELSKNIFENKLTPSQLKNYWDNDAWPKYEAVRNLIEPDSSPNGDAICPENQENKKGRRFTMDELERFEKSQEYKYIFEAINEKDLNTSAD
ncbi:hypothetical protein GALMADRAFT_154482, partial [Galerina marginata CBS 339.88]